MKKIFSIFITFLIGCCAFAQEAEVEEPIIIVAPDTIIDKTAYSLSEQGVTIAVSYGSAYPADYKYNNIGRTYFAVLAGGSMTISAEKPLKGVAINGWTKKNFSATSDRGTLDYLSDSSEDSTGEPVLTISDIDNTSVTLSCDKQLRCFSVEVYVKQDDEQGLEDIVNRQSSGRKLIQGGQLLILRGERIYTPQGQLIP